LIYFLLSAAATRIPLISHLCERVDHSSKSATRCREKISLIGTKVN
jgi:hypothetical protein